VVPPEDGNVVCLICVGVFCSVRSPFLGTMLCQFFHATEKNVERVARCYASSSNVFACNSNALCLQFVQRCNDWYTGRWWLAHTKSTVSSSLVGVMYQTHHLSKRYCTRLNTIAATFSCHFHLALLLLLPLRRPARCNQTSTE